MVSPFLTPLGRTATLGGRKGLGNYQIAPVQTAYATSGTGSLTVTRAGWAHIWLVGPGGGGIQGGGGPGGGGGGACFKRIRVSKGQVISWSLGSPGATLPSTQDATNSTVTLPTGLQLVAGGGKGGSGTTGGAGGTATGGELNRTGGSGGNAANGSAGEQGGAGGSGGANGGGGGGAAGFNDFGTFTGGAGATGGNTASAASVPGGGGGGSVSGSPSSGALGHILIYVTRAY